MRRLDKDDWREVCWRLCPHWTDEEFEAAWSEFQALKRKKAMN